MGEFISKFDIHKIKDEVEIFWWRRVKSSKPISETPRLLERQK
jgi:hypothetical protein